MYREGDGGMLFGVEKYNFVDKIKLYFYNYIAALEVVFTVAYWTCNNRYYNTDLYTCSAIGYHKKHNNRHKLNKF